MNRANPKVFLVAESAAGPLPDNEGPMRLIVYGDLARSAYGLARIELEEPSPKTARAGSDVLPGPGRFDPPLHIL